MKKLSVQNRDKNLSATKDVSMISLNVSSGIFKRDLKFKFCCNYFVFYLLYTARRTNIHSSDCRVLKAWLSRTCSGKNLFCQFTTRCELFRVVVLKCAGYIVWRSVLQGLLEELQISYLFKYLQKGLRTSHLNIDSFEGNFRQCLFTYYCENICTVLLF